MKYSKELAESKRRAKKAGEIMLEYFDGEQAVQIKADDSSVTKADILINEMVIIEEAGGRITGMDGDDLDYGQPFKGAIISNGKIHNKLVEIVSS